MRFQDGASGSSTTNVRSARSARLDPDPATHPLEELTADVQAKAGAADPTGEVRVKAIELLEDPHVLGPRDAEALVLDGEAKVLTHDADCPP